MKSSKPILLLFFIFLICFSKACGMQAARTVIRPGAIRPVITRSASSAVERRQIPAQDVRQIDLQLGGMRVQPATAPSLARPITMPVDKLLMDNPLLSQKPTVPVADVERKDDIKKDSAFFNNIIRQHADGKTLGFISDKALQELIAAEPQVAQLFKTMPVSVKDGSSLIFFSKKSGSGSGYIIMVQQADAQPTLRGIYGTGQMSDLYDRIDDNLANKVKVVTLKTSKAFIKDVIAFFQPVLNQIALQTAKELAAAKATQELIQARELEKQQAQEKREAEQQAQELAELEELVRETMSGVEAEVNLEKQVAEEVAQQEKQTADFYEKAIAQLRQKAAQENTLQEQKDLAEIEAYKEQAAQHLEEFKQQQEQEVEKSQAQRQAEMANFIESEQAQFIALKEKQAYERELIKQQQKEAYAQEETEIENLQKEQEKAQEAGLQAQHDLQIKRAQLQEALDIQLDRLQERQVDAEKDAQAEKLKINKWRTKALDAIAERQLQAEQELSLQALQEQEQMTLESAQRKTVLEDTLAQLKQEAQEAETIAHRELAEVNKDLETKKADINAAQLKTLQEIDQIKSKDLESIDQDLQKQLESLEAQKEAREQEHLQKLAQLEEGLLQQQRLIELEQAQRLEQQKQEKAAQEKLALAELLANVQKVPQEPLASAIDKPQAEFEIKKEIAEEMPEQQPRSTHAPQAGGIKPVQQPVGTGEKAPALEVDIAKNITEEMQEEPPRPTQAPREGGIKEPQQQIEGVAEKPAVAEPEMVKESPKEVAEEQPVPVRIIQPVGGGAKLPQQIISGGEKAPALEPNRAKNGAKEELTLASNGRTVQPISGGAKAPQKTMVEAGEKTPLQETVLDKRVPVEYEVAPTVAPSIKEVRVPEKDSGFKPSRQQPRVEKPTIYPQEQQTYSFVQQPTSSFVSGAKSASLPQQKPSINNAASLFPSRQPFNVNRGLTRSEGLGYNKGNVRDNSSKPLERERGFERTTATRYPDSWYQPIEQPARSSGSTQISNVPVEEEKKSLSVVPQLKFSPNVPEEVKQIATDNQEVEQIIPENEPEEEMYYNDTPLQIVQKEQPPLQQNQPEVAPNIFIRLLMWIKQLLLKIVSPLRNLFGS